MGLIDKLKASWHTAYNKVSSIIDTVLNTQSLDQSSIDSLRKALLSIDIGREPTEKIIQMVQNLKIHKKYDSTQIKIEIAKSIIESLKESEQTLQLSSDKLNVVMICGINGSGKTTSIAKIVKYFQRSYMPIVIGACDTWRAAAVEQLSRLCNNVDQNISFIAPSRPNEDPASVTYKAITHAIENNAKIVFIDTAGRLQNNSNLMGELQKISKIIQKFDVLYHALLVIDATTGQNAWSQFAHFNQVVNLTGLIVTKTDGTAKAGVLTGLMHSFKIPIYFIGTGEKISDIQEFSLQQYVYNLLGIETN